MLGDRGVSTARSREPPNNLGGNNASFRTRVCRASTNACLCPIFRLLNKNQGRRKLNFKGGVKRRQGVRFGHSTPNLIHTVSLSRATPISRNAARFCVSYLLSRRLSVLQPPLQAHSPPVSAAASAVRTPRVGQEQAAADGGRYLLTLRELLWTRRSSTAFVRERDDDIFRLRLSGRSYIRI